MPASQGRARAPPSGGRLPYRTTALPDRTRRHRRSAPPGRIRCSPAASCRGRHALQPGRAAATPRPSFVPWPRHTGSQASAAGVRAARGRLQTACRPNRSPRVSSCAVVNGLSAPSCSRKPRNSSAASACVSSYNARSRSCSARLASISARRACSAARCDSTIVPTSPATTAAVVTTPTATPTRCRRTNFAARYARESARAPTGSWFR